MTALMINKECYGSRRELGLASVLNLFMVLNLFLYCYKKGHFPDESDLS